MGNLAPACAVYVSPVINLLKPKSATFTTWFSPTKQFLAARSLQGKRTIHKVNVVKISTKRKIYSDESPLTCEWSSSFPGIPWQKRSAWPCREAPRRSPPPYHTLSGSPVGSHVACTQLQYKRAAPTYTHLCGTWMRLSENYSVFTWFT